MSLSLVFFTIAYGDRVTVYNQRKGYHIMGYDKNISGTGVRLEFPHEVKFHTDSCLRCRGMILSYDTQL